MCKTKAVIVIAHLTGTISEGSEEIVQEPMTSQSLKGYFCADTVFNLSKTIRTEIEIKDFSIKMRSKWYFRNELSDNLVIYQRLDLSLTTWKPPAGHRCV